MQNQIKTFNPDTSIHAAFIERFNRTLQRLIYTFNTGNETYRYIDALPQLVQTYNNRKHRMIGTTPVIAENDETTHLEIRKLAAKYHETIKSKPIVFRIGDTVRIAKIKDKFSRGYNEQQMLEIYKIKEIKTNNKIPMYVLETYNGDETIVGSFYSFELVKITGDIFRVEKVIKKRRRNNKLEYFVKWKGFNDNYNSWIDSTDVAQQF